MTYYKMLIHHEDPEWITNEFQQGRVRFGWSGPEMDLRQIETIPVADRTETQRKTWRYTQFLLKRLVPGDRIVLQNGRPLTEFWIGEVTADGYDFDDPARPDFNHIVHCTPLTLAPVPIGAQCIPASLRQSLSVRGHYYKIRPGAVHHLDAIVDNELWRNDMPQRERTEQDELDDARASTQQEIIRSISSTWPSKHLEAFCEALLNVIPNVEVVERVDRRRGWDLLIRIFDPIGGGLLLDDVPVQCKCFTGAVTDPRPIEDLRRSIENSKSDVAYLFILGELTPEFESQLENMNTELQERRQRPTEFVVIDQKKIAELYLRYLHPDPVYGD